MSDQDIPPQMKTLNMVIPILRVWNSVEQSAAPLVSQWKMTIRNDGGIKHVRQYPIGRRVTFARALECSILRYKSYHLKVLLSHRVGGDNQHTLFITRLRFQRYICVIWSSFCRANTFFFVDRNQFFYQSMHWQSPLPGVALQRFKFVVQPMYYTLAILTKFS